jgi:hypothetical protein
LIYNQVIKRLFLLFSEINSQSLLLFEIKIVFT